MISRGESSISLEDIYNVTTEIEIACYYLDISSIPCRINSPLRPDKNPSFGIYSPNETNICWTDFSTGDKGGIFSLLSKLWGISYKETLTKIYKDFRNYKTIDKEAIKYNKKTSYIHINKKNTILSCKVREWRNYDIEYWKSYGISINWLKYANVYPISHKIVIKEGQKYIFGADKYAYVFVEFKEGKITLKIYQPYNKQGFKWTSKHDKSVISLWTKIPCTGDKVCVCSSLKDALCLWSNIGIPSIATQGEGYTISNTAIIELKRRFKNIYILFDNDKVGIEDAQKLAEKTGFINIILPNINGAKDISDLFLTLKNKEKFKKILTDLFK